MSLEVSAGEEGQAMGPRRVGGGHLHSWSSELPHRVALGGLWWSGETEAVGCVGGIGRAK